MTTGPLSDVRVIELAGLGATPFVGMVLADLGAEVIYIERTIPWDPDRGMDPRLVMTRNRRSIALDLKRSEATEIGLRLVESADVLIEGFRPGVAERLGLGPDVCLQRNRRLVYGRMTGWGQDGPLSQAAGHDINYIAISGALGSIGRSEERPQPPINYVGDLGGGAMFLVVGVLAALLEARTSGSGQVIDAAMVDGAALLTTMLHEMHGHGSWRGYRGRDFLNGGSHFYEVYETADDKYVAVGAIEPEFYAELLDALGLRDEEQPSHLDRESWPMMKEQFAALFRTKTRDDWCAILEGTDACFSPVLELLEAPHHVHNRARGTFTEVGGIRQPAPAPRFSRTPLADPSPCPDLGEDTDAILASLGFARERIAALRAAGIVG